MLSSTVYIRIQAEAIGRYEKAIEDHGTGRKPKETYGSLWKTQEQSIDK